MHELGNLYVISAPSGTGKTTLVKALIEETTHITVSISHTTRPKRPAETNGINYYFIDTETFQNLIHQGEFLEYANVFDQFYGTSRQWVMDTLAKGLDVILEIDWQGCQQIKFLFPDCISIFILPPSLESLSNRLHARNQDNLAIIQQRLVDASKSTTHINEYDFVVVNDDFKTAVEDLKTIILAGRLIQRRQCQKYAHLIQDLGKTQNTL